MPARPRLAIVDLSMPGWTAGATYVESVARSLVMAGAKQELDLVALSSPGRRAEWAADLEIPSHECPIDWRGRVRSALDPVVPSRWGAAADFGARVGNRVVREALGDVLSYEADRAGASVVLPLIRPLARGKFRRIGWIPDFQHVYQPSFFTPEERSARDALFRRLVAESDRVILSSSWALSHFETFTPEHAAKGLRAPFPSVFAFRDLPRDVGFARAKYRLPEKYALVTNQVWRHKNHVVVVDAVARARALGVDVPVVMIGAPADYRDPENKNLSELLQRISRAGVHDLVRVLGGVPREDLVDLTRGAAVCIQPSLFEGWSTTVEDAKTLGRPLLCSDLPVHREQAKDALGFFACDDPEGLAQHLVRTWGELSPRHDPAREAETKRGELAVARAFGEALLGAALGIVGRASR